MFGGLGCRREDDQLMPYLRLIALSSLLSLATGCRTLIQSVLSGDGPAAFGGIRFLASEIDCSQMPLEDLIGFGVLALVDGPLCLGLDLLLLPISIPWEVLQGGLEVGWDRISLF